LLLVSEETNLSLLASLRDILLHSTQKKWLLWNRIIGAELERAMLALNHDEYWNHSFFINSISTGHQNRLRDDGEKKREKSCLMKHCMDLCMNISKMIQRHSKNI